MDNSRLVPLVDDTHVDFCYTLTQPRIECCVEWIAIEPQVGKTSDEVVDGAGVDPQQVGQGPVVGLFEAHGAVAASLQRAHQAAQKVRIAMIPVGDHRLGEEGEARHAASFMRVRAYTSR